MPPYFTTCQSKSHGSEYTGSKKGLTKVQSKSQEARPLTRLSRPWTPAADIWYLTVRTFAWLAFACCGFAWR